MGKKRKPLPQGVNYAQVLAAEKAKKERERQLEMQFNANIYVERALWLAAVSISDAYGFGPKRMEAYFAKLKENSEEFERMDREDGYEYALEKLRQKAEKITGEKLTYLYEKELREMQEGGEKHG